VERHTRGNDNTDCHATGNPIQIPADEANRYGSQNTYDLKIVRECQLQGASRRVRRIGEGADEKGESEANGDNATSGATDASPDD
jgi:hypothetical protein